MNQAKTQSRMPAGNAAVVREAVDLSRLGMALATKPLIIGGLAMEYYGIRKRGADVDFIVTDADYQALARRYPDGAREMDGDLILSIGDWDLMRSYFLLDYDFFARDAAELGGCKVIAPEKLFLMKVLVHEKRPGIEKYARDYGLMRDYLLETYQNKAYGHSIVRKTP